MTSRLLRSAAQERGSRHGKPSASCLGWRSALRAAGPFSRHQLSSLAATVVDFSLVVGLRELAGLWYVAARAFGALGGAITNFTLNRQWSFRVHGSRDGLAGGQALRYAAVSATSLGLNTLGTWAVTEGTGLHYAASTLAVALVVGWAFNYPLHRHFVFRKPA